MARPQLEAKRERYTVRLLRTEKEEIETQALRAGMTTSEFIRRRALGLRVVPKVEERLMNELRRQGGLVKHLASQIPELRGPLNEVLREVILTLKQMRGEDRRR